MSAAPLPRLASASAGTLVHAVDDEALGRVEIAVLDPHADLDVVHRWVTTPSARFWGLGALSRDELRDVYAYVDGLPSHHAFVIRRDGLPIVLLQTYEPENDPLGDAYPVRAGDVGIHFLLGDRGAPVRGFTTRVAHVLVGFLFAQPGAQRIVIEPDVGNARAVARARLMGFELGPRVDLPGKCGQLAFLTRRAWEAHSGSLPESRPRRNGVVTPV